MDKEEQTKEIALRKKAEVPRHPLKYYRRSVFYEDDDACKPRPLCEGCYLTTDWAPISEYVHIVSVLKGKKPIKYIDKGNSTFRNFRCYDEVCSFFLSFGRTSQHEPW